MGRIIFKADELGQLEFDDNVGHKVFSDFASYLRGGTPGGTRMLWESEAKVIGFAYVCAVESGPMKERAETVRVTVRFRQIAEPVTFSLHSQEFRYLNRDSYPDAAFANWLNDQSQPSGYTFHLHELSRFALDFKEVVHLHFTII